MKGILLSGGKGTRLYPLTTVMSKQLMPVYDKPMIYYPLSTLMLLGIKEILIISDKSNIDIYKKMFGNGSKLGINISYSVQKVCNGIAEALKIGKDFIGNSSVCLLLGDNIFWGNNLINVFNPKDFKKGAKIFGYHVSDPERFGIADVDEKGKVKSIQEKPQHPKSSFAITGLYFFDHYCTQYVDQLSPSTRGELEITDLNNIYVEKNELELVKLGRGIAWMDAGTQLSLIQTSNFIQAIENRENLMIGSIEETAYNCQYIDKNQYIKLLNQMPKSEYSNLLKSKEEKL